MAELQFLKSITQLRQERRDMEIEMFLKKKNQSRKRLLQAVDRELDMAQAIGLCAVAMKRPRKERSVDEERSSLWWRNGYRNWDDTACKKRLRTNRATFQFILG